MERFLGKRIKELAFVEICLKLGTVFPGSTFWQGKVDLLSVSAGLLCSYDFIIGQFLVWSIRWREAGWIPSQPFVTWVAAAAQPVYGSLGR